MTKRYTGGVISSSLPTVNSAGASGVFLLSQQADYQSRNSWPPFKVEESLRFRSSASAYLNRTPSVAGNQKTFTISFWAKIGNLGTYRSFFSAGTANPPFVDISLQNTDEFQVDMSVTAGRVSPKTTALFRDPSAWYHFVVAFDTTQATQANRVKVYVNGVEQTLSALGVAQNTDLAVNSAVAHNLGRRAVASDSYHEGYMSEVYFVDGQALTPASFGATDKDGNWSPIAYTGTYGTNGFYLNFSNNTSATTMGSDFSGNGNNWTLNGFNVSTANTSYDIMIDVPEDQSDGTANNRGNYATLNPLAMYGTNATISDGSLTSGATSTSNDRGWPSTIAAPGSGKWYAEFTFTATSGDNNGGCGIMLENGTGVPGESATTVSWRDFGTLRQNASGTTYGSALTTNDVVMVAYDASLGRVWFGKNGTWFASGDPATNANPSATGITTTGRFATYHYNFVATIRANFGQRPFAYAPPSGFKSLNTFNLPEPTIKQPNRHFDATIWTGDNTTPRNISNAGLFQPDFVWLKSRSNAYQHNLYDAVRGAGAAFSLSSDQSAAEGGNSNVYGFLSAFNSTGFQVTQGTAGSGGAPNGNAYGNQTSTTYVGWQWNAGGSTVTNTAGSISAQVRANPTAGFSVVTYTGTGSNATVGHGLSVAPSMVIVKNRGGSYNWLVYHKFMATSSPATWYMSLNSTAAASNGANVWIDDPTSTVFTVSGSYPEVNGSTNTYVAYCFAPIAGYSAFGSYTGNGSTDGTFVFTGFRPRFLIVKRTNDISSWIMTDSARSTYNVTGELFNGNTSGAEFTTGDIKFDYLSNGFKLREVNGAINASGSTYIYMAFAEAPFKYARSR